MNKIDIKNLMINPFTEIGKNWMIISAGNERSFNCMAASWGSMGALWGGGLEGRPTITIYVRPARYTDKFIDEEEKFSISFFREEYRKDILYLGSKSGRDEDKISKTKLHPTFIDGVPCYKEAKLTFICKKLYKGKIFKEGFIEKEILDQFYKEETNHIYNNASFHNVYVGEVLEAFEE